MAWFGTRTYVGASWDVMFAADGSMTWTEIKVTNPFPNTIALALSFRGENGAPDGRFLAAQTLAGLAQTTFVVRDLTVPNASRGWFTITTSPTPIVPMAIVYWALASKNQTEVYNVPIEQLDADGFPIGDAAAQPRPPDRLVWHHPPATDLLAAGGAGEEHARAVLEFLRAAESEPGSLDAAEPFSFAIGLLVDDDAVEFRSGLGGAGER